jgi:hypothetical protein
MPKPSKPPPTLPRRPLYARAWDAHRTPDHATVNEILTALRAAAEGAVRRNKGRRPREHTVSIGLRLSEALVIDIDDLAARQQMSRSEAIRYILEMSLGPARSGLLK